MFVMLQNSYIKNCFQNKKKPLNVQNVHIRKQFLCKCREDSGFVEEVRVMPIIRYRQVAHSRNVHVRGNLRMTIYIVRETVALEIWDFLLVEKIKILMSRADHLGCIDLVVVAEELVDALKISAYKFPTLSILTCIFRGFSNF